jgi:hypothetical protein
VGSVTAKLDAAMIWKVITLGQWHIELQLSNGCSYRCSAIEDFRGVCAIHRLAHAAIPTIRSTFDDSSVESTLDRC